jgi:predicted CopG family antitoxin
LEDATTVKVSRETRRKLAKVGTKDESFDQIIRRLIEFYNKKSNAKADLLETRKVS